VIAETMIRLSNETDVPELLIIWREAVSATHTFLSERDIAFYEEQVRDHYLPSCSFWVAVDADDRAQGFMGMTGSKIDALFIDPSYHGRGLGRALVTHAAAHEPTLSVDVNEQNEGAVAFYRKLGFVRKGRSEFDGSSNPFPILHMERVTAPR
jgi:putative acetyltransferase